MTSPSYRTSNRCRLVIGIVPFLLGIITVTSRFVVGVDDDNDRDLEYYRKKEPLDSSLSMFKNEDVSVWPFSHHDSNSSSYSSNNNNSSAGNHTSDDTNNKDKVCNDATTCDRCNSYYTCHWCAHDSTCHAIGSVYGCMIGSSCQKKNTPNIDPNDTATGCSAHATCRDCALSSSLCHWCGHDNMCHAVGSVYGCINGVDCYDNLHCQRAKPEPITPRRNSKSQQQNGDTDVPIYHHEIGVLPLVLILSLAGSMICCSTSCCCIMNCLKGAYDDLAIASIVQQQNRYGNTNNGRNTSDNDTDEHSPLIQGTTSVTSHQNGDENFFDCRATTDTITATTPLSETPAPTEEAASAPPAAAETASAQLLPEPSAAAVAPSEDCYIRMVDGEENTNVPSSTTMQNDVSNNGNVSFRFTFQSPTTTRPQQRRFVAMQRLYITCMGCYVCNILFIGFVAYLSIHYFPQKPIYNICNDSVAWKSLIDSMTSFKATAEFQILASVYNPNALDVALDMGKGSFSHNGDMVGTYEIPPTLIASQAITDLLIVARFTPEKWQALSITAEYYSGNLVLHVNADASIRIPALFDYTISTSLQDIVVHVNALSDRHLCSCPTWSDNNVTSYYHHERNPFEL